MGVPRRTVLVGTAALFAGCSGVTTGGAGTDTATDETTTATPSPTPADTCDPSDVTRPTAPADASVEGRPYPSMPTTVTARSVTDFLAEFERAFAWNRALGEFPVVTGVRVQTLDSIAAVAVDDGFRASGRLRVFAVVDEADGDRRVERYEYSVGYLVGDDGVYRAETADGDVDVRDRSTRQFVACSSEN
jgi:hypothetical protein